MAGGQCSARSALRAAQRLRLRHHAACRHARASFRAAPWRHRHLSQPRSLASRCQAPPTRPASTWTTTQRRPSTRRLLPPWLPSFLSTLGTRAATTPFPDLANRQLRRREATWRRCSTATLMKSSASPRHSAASRSAASTQPPRPSDARLPALRSLPALKASRRAARRATTGPSPPPWLTRLRVRRRALRRRTW